MYFSLFDMLLKPREALKEQHVFYLDPLYMWGHPQVWSFPSASIRGRREEERQLLSGKEQEGKIKQFSSPLQSNLKPPVGPLRGKKTPNCCQGRFVQLHITSNLGFDNKQTCRHLGCKQDVQRCLNYICNYLTLPNNCIIWRSLQIIFLNVSLHAWITVLSI